MRLQLTANQEVALLTQERDEILAERDLYRKQLFDALSDLKLRHNENLDLKEQYNDVCNEHLDLKQQYNEVRSELSDMKRELARERLKVSAGHSHGKGVLGDSAENITTDNTDVSSELTTVSASSTGDGTVVGGGGGRSISENQITARTTFRTAAIANLPETAGRGPENTPLPRVCTPLPAELPRAHTPLPVVDNIDEGQVPPPPMSETPTKPVSSPMPTSAPVPIQDHIPPFAHSGSMETPVGMQTKALILKYGTNLYIDSKPLIDLVNKSRCETDARTLKDVVNVIYEMTVKGEIPQYGTICEDMAKNIDSNVRDSETRDVEGNPMGGGRLFKKLLIHRCKVDFERWVSFASSSNHQALNETDSGPVDWDEEVGRTECEQSAKLLRLLNLLRTLNEKKILPEWVMLDCMERLVSPLEAGTSVCVCIEGLDALLVSPAWSSRPELRNKRTRGRMDVCFERMKELAWPQSPYTTDIGIDMKGMLRTLIDELRRRKWM